MGRLLLRDASSGALLGLNSSDSHRVSTGENQYQQALLAVRTAWVEYEKAISEDK
jgi:hypothetical protein